MRVRRTKRQLGFTLIEMLGCVVLLAGGLAVAVAGGRHYGWLGVLIGFPVGFLGMGVIFLLLIAVPELLWWAGPMYPPCHTGSCQWREWSPGFGDYRFAKVDGDLVLRCRCGRDYDRRGRRFMERLPDGTFKPYMVHRPFRGWFPDIGIND